MKEEHLPIYLDCHATTPVDQRVASRMMEAMLSDYGNPNSADHRFGEQARCLVEKARNEVGQLVGAVGDRIFFFGSASQAIERAIFHALSRRKDKAVALRVAATSIEHHAVLHTLHAHALAGDVDLQLVDVDPTGRVHTESVKQVCERGIDLLCVMSANNEVGTINPINDIATIARHHKVLILVDASQSAGFVPLRSDDWDLDYTVLCAHKMYGPKGVGALVLGSSSASIGQHFSDHSGTPNMPGIVGFGEACRLRRLGMDEDVPRIAALRDCLQRELLRLIPSLVVNGDPTSRLCGNLHISIPSVPGGAVTARLHDKVAISTGAACSYGTDEESHVLKAMNAPESIREGSLRIGLGVFTTQAEIDVAAVLIAGAVEDVRRMLQ